MELQQNLTILTRLNTREWTEFEIKIDAHKPICGLSDAQMFISSVYHSVMTRRAAIDLGTLELAFLVNDYLLEYFGRYDKRKMFPNERGPIEIGSIVAPTGEFGLEAQIWLAHELKRCAYWSR